MAYRPTRDRRSRCVGCMAWDGARAVDARGGAPTALWWPVVDQFYAWAVSFTPHSSTNLHRQLTSSILKVVEVERSVRARAWPLQQEANRIEREIAGY
jgi:hypothetical protein